MENSSCLNVGAEFPWFRKVYLSEPGKAMPERERTPAERRAAMTWAQRLKRVFNIDISVCEQCGGSVRIIACIEDPIIIERILTHLAQVAAGAAAKAHTRSDRAGFHPGRGPPQLESFA